MSAHVEALRRLPGELAAAGGPRRLAIAIISQRMRLARLGTVEHFVHFRPGPTRPCLSGLPAGPPMPLRPAGWRRIFSYSSAAGLVSSRYIASSLKAAMPHSPEVCSTVTVEDNSPPDAKEGQAKPAHRKWRALVAQSNRYSPPASIGPDANGRFKNPWESFGGVSFNLRVALDMRREMNANPLPDPLPPVHKPDWGHPADRTPEALQAWGKDIKTTWLCVYSLDMFCVSTDPLASSAVTPASCSSSPPRMQARKTARPPAASAFSSTRTFRLELRLYSAEI